MIAMLKSHELFGFMSSDLARRILEDTTHDNKEVYDATLAAVANVRRLRPAYLKKQPRKARHDMVLNALTRPGFEEAAGGLIRGWLLKHQVNLLTQFLDKLDIEHENGVVEDLPPEMDDAKLNSAIDQILEGNESEVVILYLHAFHAMNGAGWANLETLLTADERLQF